MIRRAAIVAVWLLSMQVAAAAQSWPSRPIRAIIPFSAGSATDIVPRIVFEQLSPQLGRELLEFQARQPAHVGRAVDGFE